MKKDGTRIQVDTASHSILFEGGKARFTLAQDVTERQQLHDRLLHQASTTPSPACPTGCSSPIAWSRPWPRQSVTAIWPQSSVSTSIASSRSTTRIGHAVGDLCLKKLAERLCARLRASDTVARSGGEEFTVLLGDLLTASDAEVVVAELLSVIRQPFFVNSYKLDISASIGIALYPTDGTDAQALWRSADTAMYRAKHSGGNQYVFVSNEISASASEANEIEVCLRHALRGRRL